MLIGKVISKYPETIEVFLKQGLHCIGCQMANYESVELSAKAHGTDLKKLLKELNKVIE